MFIISGHKRCDREHIFWNGKSAKRVFWLNEAHCLVLTMENKGSKKCKKKPESSVNFTFSFWTWVLFMMPSGTDCSRPPEVSQLACAARTASSISDTRSLCSCHSRNKTKEVMGSCYLGWLKLQALVYSNLPPTTATDYARGLGKLLANGLFCVGAQMAVSSNNIFFFFMTVPVAWPA